MSWPLAVMVSVAIIAISVASVLERDIAAISSAILTLLVALGLVELRDIKSQTNGTLEALRQQKEQLQEELNRYKALFPVGTPTTVQSPTIEQLQEELNRYKALVTAADAVPDKSEAR